MGDYESALGSVRIMEECVGLLAAPAKLQYRWLVQNGYPTSELWNQLDAAVPSWFPVIREHLELSNEVEDALVDLLSFLDTTEDPAWGDDLDALQNPAWDHIRERALAVLALMSTATYKPTRSGRAR